MALVRMKELLQDALEKHYTVGAFNFFDLNMLYAIMEAAKAEDSPVIVQICMGGRNYMKSFPRMVRIVKEYCSDYGIPTVLNHDHCPTVEEAMYAIDCGIDSVMFDGSALSFEDNVRQTKRIVAYAHGRGAAVEAELGCLPGFEDMVFAETAVLTDPKSAKRFVELTQCDALAVSVGTAHGGVLTTEHLPLYFDRLQSIMEAVPELPLVLHGAASLPAELFERINQWGGRVEQMRICSEKDISKCGAYHVCKANMDVDNFIVYTAEIRKKLMTEPQEYNPKGYTEAAREAFMEEVRHKMRDVTRSTGHNWLKEKSDKIV